MAKEIEQGTVMQGDTIGELRIADDVVAHIAGIAATEVEGVSATAGNVPVELMNIVGLKSSGKAIKVEMDGAACIVNIGLIIKYGYHIPDVCRKVQERIKTAIETMTGLSVKEIRIRVEGIDMKGQA